MILWILIVIAFVAGGAQIFAGLLIVFQILLTLLGVLAAVPVSIFNKLRGKS